MNKKFRKAVAGSVAGVLTALSNVGSASAVFNVSKTVTNFKRNYVTVTELLNNADVQGDDLVKRLKNLSILDEMKEKNLKFIFNENGVELAYSIPYFGTRHNLAHVVLFSLMDVDYNRGVPVFLSSDELGTLIRVWNEDTESRKFLSDCGMTDAIVDQLKKWAGTHDFYRSALNCSVDNKSDVPKVDASEKVITNETNGTNEPAKGRVNAVMKWSAVALILGSGAYLVSKNLDVQGLLADKKPDNMVPLDDELGEQDVDPMSYLELRNL